MFTKFTKFALTGSAALLALLAPAAAQNLGKPVLFNDGLSPHVDWSFWTYLNPTQSTQSLWSPGWMPQACIDNANYLSLAPKDFEVWQIQYTDCGSPWLFCRHKNSSLSMIQLVDLFGRLPVHERQWVRHVIGAPGGGSAYAWGAEIAFLGPVGAPSVFQHEVGHVLDNYKNGATSSATTGYQNAINADTCVPDSYANTNKGEDFAQVGVLSLFEIVTPGGLDVATGGPGWRCLVNQKNSLDGFQRSDMYPGGTCARRWADSPIVATPGLRVAASSRPAVVGQAGRPIPEARERTGEHTYTNLVPNPADSGSA